MKYYIQSFGLVLVALAVIAGTLYLTPIVFDFLENVSYRSIVVFLLFIIASNLLAKITKVYINL